jgi:hypothetical protein
MNQSEFAQRAWAVWRRKVPTLPAFTDCVFQFASPDEVVTLRDGKGRLLGACRQVHTVRGVRVCVVHKAKLPAK